LPTYEYRCKECGNELEVVQSFTDDALTTCEACGGPLRKVFGNVGIAFKGSGFYKNDSRGKSSTSTNGSSDSSAGTEASGSSTTSDTKSDAKPADKPEKKAEPKPAKKADTASKG
jgi:putative FmdB family regulatory protein